MTMEDAINDDTSFRNGTPVRMSAWMHVKCGRVVRRQHRFVKLQGEVLSFHFKEKGSPEQIFDVVGADIEFFDHETASATVNQASKHQMETNQSLFHQQHNQHQQSFQHPQKYERPQLHHPLRRHYSSKQIRIVTPRRIYTLIAGSSEEAHIWGHSLSFAAQHRFEDCYRLGDPIAEGTFSRIHLCYPNDPPEQTYVVKVVKKKSHDTQALEWLERERHINSALNSPTIVQSIDMFSRKDRDHLVFEYMAGGTLSDMLGRRGRDRPLPESYARVVMRQLFASLQYIHSNNVVHRDVQPDNIFLSAKKFPMAIALGDFGLSNFLHESKVNIDVLTSRVGTPPYMSVDVVRGIKYGPASDMWSTGVVLYEMLSGELPFDGSTERERVERIRRGVFVFNEKKWENISNDAKSLVKQLLQTDPNKRISSLASLQHRWIVGANGGLAPVSSTASLSIQSPPHTSGAFTVLGDRDSPGNTSVDGFGVNGPQRSSGNAMPVSVSNFSRVPSSASSASAPQSRDASGEKSTDWQGSLSGGVKSGPILGNGERESSSVRRAMLMNQSLSMMQLQHVSSVSSISNTGTSQGGHLQQPRIQMTPSVRAIKEKGLQRVASDNPSRMKRLLSSKVVQRQLSMALPYRRRFVVIAKAFVAVFRLRAISKGHTTRQLSRLDASVDDVDALMRRRKDELSNDLARASNDGLGLNVSSDFSSAVVDVVRKEVVGEKSGGTGGKESGSVGSVARRRGQTGVIAQRVSVDGAGQGAGQGVGGRRGAGGSIDRVEGGGSSGGRSNGGGRMKGHVRQRSREIAVNIMSKLTADRKVHEGTAGGTHVGR